MVGGEAIEAGDSSDVGAAFIALLLDPPTYTLTYNTPPLNPSMSFQRVCSLRWICRFYETKGVETKDTVLSNTFILQSQLFICTYAAP